MSFYLISAFLVLLVLAFVVPPLWKARQTPGNAATNRQATLAVLRGQLTELEQEQREGLLAEADFAQAKQDIQRRLLDEISPEQAVPVPGNERYSRLVAACLLILLPVFALAGYWMLGNPRALDPVARTQPSEVTPAQIEQMVQRLASRLEANPGDTEGWAMLAKSYKSLGKLKEAAQAYGKIESALSTDPDALADYADLLAQQAGGRLDGKPLDLVMQALSLDPTHLQALWLAGTAKFAGADYAAAISYWQRALAVLPPESEDAKMLADGVAEAQRRSKAPTNSAKSISGQVTVSPKIAGSFAPDDTVFVIARRAQGPRMPVAVAMVKVSDLPYQFTLNDQLSMVPEVRISDFSELVVEARISHGGDVKLKTGDGFSKAGSIKVGTRGLRLLIDSVAE